MSGFKSPQEYQQFLRSQLGTPEANGLFRAIAGPEGTLKSDGTFAYWRQFGGNDLDPSKIGPGHPNQVINKGRYSSAATGFAQFMPGTWNAANTALGGNLDFRKPEDQKIAALHLARKRTEDLGGLAYLKEKGLTPEFVAKLSPEWASLPTLEGTSYYGQPVKPYDFVKQKYDEGLKASGATATPSSTEVAQAPSTTTPSTPTSPTITDNGDGTQQVSVPGGVVVNIALSDGKKKDSNTIADVFMRQYMEKIIGGGSNDIASSLLRNGQNYFNKLQADILGDLDSGIA